MFGSVEVGGNPDVSCFMERGAEQSRISLSSREIEGRGRRGGAYRKLLGGCFAERDGEGMNSN